VPTRRPWRKRRLDFRRDDDLFGQFALAEKLGKTRAELLSGQPQPLSSAEFTYWTAFFEVVAEVEKEELKKAEKEGKRKGRTG
jgi:hypothetical protein